MKLLILGATGGTGREIVGQALERGHAVTALVRSPEGLKRFGDRVKAIQGDLLNSADLRGAIDGQDAVLSGFGPRVPVSKGDVNLLWRFSVALTTAMLQTHTRRLVVVSVAFLFRGAVLPPAYLIGRLFMPRIVADASAMESVVTKSTLDWTIVRPPKLTNNARTQKYRVEAGHLPLFGFSISRADVADLMMECAEDRTTIGKIFGVCN